MKWAMNPVTVRMSCGFSDPKDSEAHDAIIEESAMRGSQLTRQWKILLLIKSRQKGITGSEIASQLEVPVRTVYRDLYVIQQAGFPLFTEKEGKFSMWKILDTFKINFGLL